MSIVFFVAHDFVGTPKNPLPDNVVRTAPNGPF